MLGLVGVTAMETSAFDEPELSESLSHPERKRALRSKHETTRALKYLFIW
jgi:hypothetical protein